MPDDLGHLEAEIERRLNRPYRKQKLMQSDVRLVMIDDGTRYRGQVCPVLVDRDQLLVVELEDGDGYTLLPGEYHVYHQAPKPVPVPARPEVPRPEDPVFFVCPRCKARFWDHSFFNEALMTRCCGTSQMYLLAQGAVRTNELYSPTPTPSFERVRR